MKMNNALIRAMNATLVRGYPLETLRARTITNMLLTGTYPKE